MYTLFMQATFSFFALLGKIPYTLAFFAILYLFIRVLRAFVQNYLSSNEPNFFKYTYNFFDPYHQGIFCYKYKWYTVILLIGAIYLLCKIYVPPEMISGECGMYAKHNILYNTITYLPNYLLHEMLGHNTFCPISNNWFCALSGDLIQVLVPATIYLFSLQLRGGLLFTPILFYWLSAAIYDAGIYASDAAFSKLALTSADMVTTFKAGVVKGDWYNILQPFNAINMGTTIGTIFEVIACILFALAIYSFVEYISRLSRNEMNQNIVRRGEL